MHLARLVICALLVVASRAGAEVSIGDFANVTAGHYQVLAQGGLEMGQDVNQFMNEMLKQYSSYFSNWTPKENARVVVFNNLDDFREYSRNSIGMTHPGLAGYCHLKTDEDGNPFFELVTYEHERLWQVLAHEGFHQFIGYELGLGIPIWLNEGMAQFFENSTVKKGRLTPGGIDKSKLALAQNVILTRRAVPLDDLLTMDRGTFYAHAEVTYPMSWALVYYLMTRDNRNYQSSEFRRYLQDLKYNHDDIASFRKRFGSDSAEWQRDFNNFILELRPPPEK